MKLFVPIILIFMVSGLNVRNQTHQSTGLVKHQEPITLSLIAAGVGAAIALTNFLKGAFTTTCGKGYKRGVNLNVLNKLPAPITSLGHYEDSGKVLEYGQQQIKKYEYSRYYFIKKWGSSTGACGITAWKLSPKDVLVLYYENPWSGWNFQGACVYLNQNLPSQKFQSLPYDTLQKFYKDLEAGHQNWPSNCKELDNTQTKDQSWYASSSFTVGRYFVQLVAKYAYEDQAGSDDCYIAELDVSVAIKK